MIIFVSAKLLAVFLDFLVCQIDMKNLPYTISNLLESLLLEPAVGDSEKLLFFIPHLEVLIVEIAALLNYKCVLVLNPHLTYIHWKDKLCPGRRN